MARNLKQDQSEVAHIAPLLPEKFEYLWRQTKYGPTNPELVKRMEQGMPCEVVTIGKNGTRWIRFDDGYEAAVLYRSIGRLIWR